MSSEHRQVSVDSALGNWVGRVRSSFFWNSRWVLFICFLLAITTTIAFWPVSDCGFVNFDDNNYVTKNIVVREGLTWRGFQWAFGTMHVGNWHPVTWLSHMLDCELYGLEPAGHHLTSLIFHVGNTLLLFLVLQKLTGALWRSAIVAALFALHPLHVASVAWVSERKDVLSTLFFLLTLWAYARYVSESKVQSPKSRVFYAVSLALFALGLMSKPMLVTLPFVLLLLDCWPLGRFQNSAFKSRLSSLRHLLLEKVPFFVMSAASCVITIYAERSGHTIGSTDAFPLSARIGNALISYFRYIVKTFWPDDLSVYYPHPGRWPLWQVIGAGLFLISVSILLTGLARRRPCLLVGWLWFLGTLLPVIGLVQVGLQAMANRYTYIPLIGLFITMVWMLAEIANRSRYRRMALAALGAGVLVVCGLVTSEQVGHWSNSLRLFAHALSVSPNSAVVHNNLGEALMRRGKWDEALPHFLTALRLRPNFPEAIGNLGTINLHQGRTEEAIAQFSHVARLRPNRPEAENNLGLAYAQLGKLDKAASHYTKALRINPGFAKAHNGLGIVLTRQGRLSEATAHFTEAVRLRPDYLEAHLNLGHALFEQGKLQEADSYYATAFQIDFRDTEADGRIGVALARQGKLNQAITYFNRALLRGTNAARTHCDLGDALSFQGKKAEAIMHYREALRLQPDKLRAINNLAWILATNRDPQCRNQAEAVRLAEHAVKIVERGRTLDTLAAAYANAGRFAEAVKTARRAMELAASTGQNEFADQIRRRLSGYESGKPHRE